MNDGYVDSGYFDDGYADLGWPVISVSQPNASFTERLIEYLYRSFSKDPERFLALRIRSSSFLVWQVENDTLSLTTSLSTTVFNLADFTLGSLCDAIAMVPSLTVEYLAQDSHLSALVLLNGSASQTESNGDHLYGYGSLLWSYMHPVAGELIEAETQIGNMIDQMSITTADGDWLDEWGDYFGIPRNLGEPDAWYSNRMIVEILRPRGNNKAIELAMLERFGQVARIEDIHRFGSVAPAYNGVFTNNGTQVHNAVSSLERGLFRAVVGYDLLGDASPNAFAAEARAFIDKFRDAGTHLETLSLSSSLIYDSAPGSTDGSNSQSMVMNIAHADATDAPSESLGAMPVITSFIDSMTAPVSGTADILVAYTHTHSGEILHNGIRLNNGGMVVAESM